MSYERAPVTECKSRIDGKLIRVRHAVEGDLLFIQNRLKELGAGQEAEDYTGYVVAEMDEKILGFGSVRGEGRGMSRFVLHVEAEHDYLAGTMVKHLAEHPLK